MELIPSLIWSLYLIQSEQINPLTRQLTSARNSHQLDLFLLSNALSLFL